MEVALSPMQRVSVLRTVFVICLILSWISARGAESGVDPDDPARKLIVATKEAPPFAFKTSEDTWHGLSIELWEQLAAALDLEFEYRELPLPEILSSVEGGTVDVAISALTITPDRENKMDFTYPYYDGGLGMAITTSRESVLWGLIKRLFSWQFISAVAALATVLFVAALFVWLFERRANPDQFGGSRLQGLGASFWWSAVTMTTVGYGDKAPKTVGGRAVALVWMFTSIIIISSFTAGIASSLTATQVAVERLRSQPLDSLVVATVERSTGEDFAKMSGLRAESFPDVERALEAVHQGRAQVVLYDLPLLRYQLKNHPRWKVEVLPRILVKESYAIALPSGSPLRESLNLALLEALRTDEWRTTQLKYLGTQQ